MAVRFQVQLSLYVPGYHVQQLWNSTTVIAGKEERVAYAKLHLPIPEDVLLQIRSA